MPITQGITKSYKSEILLGIHQAADVYKMALFTSLATIGPTTTVYDSTNEVVNGNGYTTGGATLTGLSVTAPGDVERLDFNSPTWPDSNITARGAMIYNSSKGNKSVKVIDFGADITSTNDTFTAQMPIVSDSTSLIRISG